MRCQPTLHERVTLIGTFLLGGLLVLGALTGWAEKHADASSHAEANMQAHIASMQAMAPYRGYLDAHKGVQKPQALLGGSVTVAASQDVGGVHVALPDNRRLDPYVFGTTAHPRAFGGTPGINGVPPMLREAEGNTYTVFKKKSPFGDKNVVMGSGKLSMQVVDVTAVDAATSKDSVRFEASWQDADGNKYRVTCCAKLAVHGVEYPTFGGVVTNHLMHGSSRVGTALMPTMFAYAAFWGMGEVHKNGEVIDRPRLVHGMLTEYVRKQDYQLAFDSEITPTRLHFHLMVPPMKPNMQDGVFVHQNVNTGFTLPNGKTLPFWHVMFANLEIEAERGS